MDPSLKLPPVHALFPPFASDRVGLLASIWQRGRPQLLRRSWNDALEEPSRVLASRPRRTGGTLRVLASGAPAGTDFWLESRSVSGASRFCTLPTNARRSGVAA